jgi:cysteine-rich repeat protein
LDASTPTPEPDAGSPVATCQQDYECDDGNVCNGDELCMAGQCAAGEWASDGHECALDDDTAAMLCLGGNCTASVCGDGVLDERTDEQCDDGNGVDGDGCEVGCTWSCSNDADCDDSNLCNGDEVCDANLHACSAGAPAEDGTSCGENRECLEGRCIQVGCGNGSIDDEEECDDGNLVDGDGCDADCTITCKESADCDDGNVCNGSETCDTENNVCVAGEEVSCDDRDDCTDNACDPVSGCFYPLIDGDGDGQASNELGACGLDCDDRDVTVYSGAAELCDGKDNNCNDDTDELAPTWYVDCDGDGYAVLNAAGIQQCEKPGPPEECAGRGLVGSWTSVAPSGGYDDCYDANANAKPRLTTDENNTAWSSVEETGRPIGDRFDYNCDGSEEKRYTRVSQNPEGACYTFIYVPIEAAPEVTLSIAQTDVAPIDDQIVIAPILIEECGTNNGWTGATAPACGISAEYSRCVSINGGTCERADPITRTQACR